MKFTKYNNPNKKRRRKLDRTTADIIAAREVAKGRMTVQEADRYSDKLSGLKNRGIYD